MRCASPRCETESISDKNGRSFFFEKTKQKQKREVLIGAGAHAHALWASSSNLSPHTPAAHWAGPFPCFYLDPDNARPFGLGGPKTERHVRDGRVMRKVSFSP